MISSSSSRTGSWVFFGDPLDLVTNEKRLLYILLVRSQLTQASNKYIFNDYTSDYKVRLMRLGLMYQLELTHILFCVKNLVSHFVMSDFITFSNRSVNSGKMGHTGSSTNCSRNFYFNWLPCLWNTLPPIVSSVSQGSPFKYFYQHFTDHLSQRNHILCPWYCILFWSWGELIYLGVAAARL